MLLIGPKNKDNPVSIEISCAVHRKSVAFVFIFLKLSYALMHLDLFQSGTFWSQTRIHVHRTFYACSNPPVLCARMFPVLAALPTGWLRLETSMPGCYKQLVGALTGLTARMSQDTSLVSRDVTSHQFSSVCVCVPPFTWRSPFTSTAVPRGFRVEHWSRTMVQKNLCQRCKLA